MENKQTNQILTTLKYLFDLYCIKSDMQDITSVFKLFYEKKIIDIKQVDIFQVNHFILSQIQQNPGDKSIYFKDFLSIVFLVFIRHMQEDEVNTDENSEKINSISKCLDEGMEPEDIVTNNTHIFNNKNRNTSNIINVVMNQLEDNLEYNFCFPKFEEKSVAELINHIDLIINFHDNLHELFLKYCKHDSNLDTY